MGPGLQLESFRVCTYSMASHGSRVEGQAEEVGARRARGDVCGPDRLEKAPVENRDSVWARPLEVRSLGRFHRSYYLD